jgi:hypothetical protein
MNTAIDNYFNSSYKKHGFVLPKRISIKSFMILAMIENPKEEKIDSYQK